MRFVMLSGMAPSSLPANLKGALKFIPISVLTAIIVPAVLIGEDNNIMLLNNAHLPAAIIAVIAAIVSRSVIMTISVGLGTLWLLTFFGYS
jgi:branched-subunit amino acid transport protein